MNSRIVAELLESFPKLLLPGLKVTLPLTALSFTIGIAIALATALVQIAHIPVLRRLARVYIWIIRCTPMIVQLFVVYFGLPNIGICLDSFSAAVLVFSISVGAAVGMRRVSVGRHRAPRRGALAAAVLAVGRHRPVPQPQGRVLSESVVLAEHAHAAHTAALELAGARGRAYRCVGLYELSGG